MVLCLFSFRAVAPLTDRVVARVCALFRVRDFVSNADLYSMGADATSFRLGSKREQVVGICTD